MPHRYALHLVSTACKSCQYVEHNLSNMNDSPILTVPFLLFITCAYFNHENRYVHFDTIICEHYMLLSWGKKKSKGLCTNSLCTICNDMGHKWCNKK